MKKILFYLLIVLASSSCRPDIEPLFSMPLEANFEIPAGLAGILTHTFIIRDVPNPLEGLLKTLNIDSSRISTIRPGRGELEARFTATNYQFIDRVSILMVDPDDIDNRREIYYLDYNNDNNNDSSLRLLSAVSDVEELMRKTFFDLEVKLTFRSFSPTLIENRLIFELQVFE